MSNNASKRIFSVLEFFNVLAWVFVVIGLILVPIAIDWEDSLFIGTGICLFTSIQIWLFTPFIRGFGVIVQSHEQNIVETENKPLLCEDVM